MLPSGSIVKETAKTAMKGNRLNLSVGSVALVFVFLINGLLSAVLAEITTEIIALAFEMLFLIFVILPLLFGTVRFFRRAVWGEKESPAEIFYCFGGKAKYLRALSLGVKLALRFGITLLVCLIPAGILYLFGKAEFYSALNILMPSFAPSLSVVAIIFEVLGVSAAILINLKYYLAPFFAYANEEISTNEAIRMSRIVARGSLPDFCWLLISFIGWIIISILVIPLVFTLPYFLSCYTVHARFSVAQYNKTVKPSDNSFTYNV